MSKIFSNGTNINAHKCLNTTPHFYTEKTYAIDVLTEDWMALEDFDFDLCVYYKTGN